MKKKGIKKYIYFALIIIAIGCAVWYFIAWRNVIEKEKYAKSYITTTNTTTLVLNNIDEMAQVLKEAPSKFFIYISYANDKKAYELETKFKKIIDNYHINDILYYVDVTEYDKNDDFYKKLNEQININTIDSLPCILYFEDGKLTKILDNDNLNIKNLEKLLKEHDYEK